MAARDKRAAEVSEGVRKILSINDNIPAAQYNKAISHMTEVLKNLGIDLDDENFQKTPTRFVKYLAEFLQPYDQEEILQSSFSTKHQEYNGMVVQTNIPFRAVCAHHLLPFLGHASVGYIPNKHVVGLSKISRLVTAAGLETPSLQETITDTLADAIMKELEPRGVIAVISASHTCMACRGAAVPDVPTITSSVRGAYRDVPAARTEFFSLIGMHHLR